MAGIGFGFEGHGLKAVCDRSKNFSLVLLRFLGKSRGKYLDPRRLLEGTFVTNKIVRTSQEPWIHRDHSVIISVELVSKSI